MKISVLTGVVGAIAVAAVALVLTAGAYALVVCLLVVLAVTALVIRWALRVGNATNLSTTSPRSWRGAIIPLAICGVAGIALAIAVGIQSAWHKGGPGAALITILHYRYLLVVAVVTALAVGTLVVFYTLVTVSHDEHTHSQSRADKEHRAQRTARRREDREAARQRRREQRSSS